MSLYENILNISNKNIEEEIKSSIIDTRRQLCNLNEDRMCLIYSSYIYQNLKKRHILSHIIDTKYLGLNYQHRFVLVYAKNYYLIDLTYSQFLNNDSNLIELLKNGYQKIDNNCFELYLKGIENYEKVIDLDEAFIR